MISSDINLYLEQYVREEIKYFNTFNWQRLMDKFLKLKSIEIQWISAMKLKVKKWGQKFADLGNICWKEGFLKTTSNEWKDPK